MAVKPTYPNSRTCFVCEARQHARQVNPVKKAIRLHALVSRQLDVLQKQAWQISADSEDESTAVAAAHTSTAVNEVQHDLAELMVQLETIQNEWRAAQ